MPVARYPITNEESKAVYYSAHLKYVHRFEVKPDVFGRGVLISNNIVMVRLERLPTPTPSTKYT